MGYFQNKCINEACVVKKVGLDLISNNVLLAPAKFFLFNNNLRPWDEFGK